MPEYFCTSSALAYRSRRSPKAAASRGANTSAAPGNEANSATSGSVRAEGFDLTIEALHREQQCTQLLDERFDQQPIGLDHRTIGGQCRGAGDAFNAGAALPATVR